MSMKLTLLASILLFSSAVVAQDQPIATDSRIKTFVYSENDVYNLVMRYGYQTNIEFSKGETVETISLGERVAWQVIPAGRRIFIRPMEESAHTNMTVVTDKRTYQFDLTSTQNLEKNGEELAYVVRFFYADDKKPSMAAPAPVVMQEPVVSSAPVVPVMSANEASLNYQYSYSGPDGFAPVKIYDDGKVTYFKFDAGVKNIPNISVVGANQKEMPVSHRFENDMVVVDTTAREFALRQGSEVVYVFNEIQ